MKTLNLIVKIIFVLVCMTKTNLTQSQTTSSDSAKDETVFLKLSDTLFSKGSLFRITERIFKYDSKELNEKGTSILDSIAQFMAKNPKIVFEIRTHLSNVTYDYSLNLSQKRARTIVDYLVKKEIDQSRLKPKGLGEIDPLIPDEKIKKLSQKEQEKAHELNRRTEFFILSTGN